MATSRLLAPSCLPTVPRDPRAPYSIPFSELTPWQIETKKATYFIYVSKVRWKEGRKEGAGAYHSIPELISLHPCGSILPDRRRWERSAPEEDGGRYSTEMVVVLICQRNTALRVLLKRPHKPELSEVGGRGLTSGHTNIDCEFSAWLSCMQSHPSTSQRNRESRPCLFKTLSQFSDSWNEGTNPGTQKSTIQKYLITLTYII